MSTKIILEQDKGHLFVLPDTLEKKGDVYCLPNSICIDEISYGLLQRPTKTFVGVVRNKRKNLYSLYPISKEDEKKLNIQVKLPSQLLLGKKWLVKVDLENLSLIQVRK